MWERFLSITLENLFIQWEHQQFLMIIHKERHFYLEFRRILFEILRKTAWIILPLHSLVEIWILWRKYEQNKFSNTRKVKGIFNRIEHVKYRQLKVLRIVSYNKSLNPNKIMFSFILQRVPILFLIKASLFKTSLTF